ncbi:Ig-like domain-containing protein, partial [Buttiauxella noackiae]|uniref:Ig-like domain-containing protein n=1 Tax=Buttiauxella noackiae TaxID=82992 RepID=UPI002352B2FF
TTAGVSTVTAVLGSASVTVDVTFIADSNTATLAAGSLVVVTDNAIASGTVDNSVKATVTDANGNRVSGVSVNFSASNSATIAATGTSDANGEIEMTLTSTRAGTSTVTAILGSASVTTNVSFVTPTITITKVLDTQLAMGKEANTFKITVKGFQGALVPDQAVNLSTREATSVIDVGATADTDANGELAVGVTNPGAPGTTDILYATVAGTTVQASASHTWLEKYNFNNKQDVTTIGTQGVTTYSVRRTCTWTVTKMTTEQPASTSFGYGLRQANAVLGTAPKFPSNGTNLVVSGGTFTVTSDIGWGGAGVANTQNFQLRVGSMANDVGNTAYLVANDGKINCSAVDAYND